MSQYPTAATSAVTPAPAASIGDPPTPVDAGNINTPDSPALLCIVREAMAELASVASAESA